MTKNIRKIFGFLLGLFMFLSVMVPSLAMAEEAMPSGNARPRNTNLHIHKLQFNYDPLFISLKKTIIIYQESKKMTKI